MSRHVMLTIALVCLSTGRFASAIVVNNAGFETVVPINDFPITAYGVWTGDLGFMVTAENSIVPVEGSRMLRFEDEVSTTANIWNLVDVSSLPTGSLVTLSAAFDRVAGSNPTAQLRIAAINHGPPSPGTEFDANIIGLLQQSIPDNSWTTLSLSAVLPAGTVAIGVEVAHQGIGPAYADNVQLTPEPSTLVLGCIGLAGLAYFRWRRAKRVLSRPKS